MAAPLKNGNFVNPFFPVRKGPNIGREPKFHDPTTYNVKDYPGQPKPEF